MAFATRIFYMLIVARKGEEGLIPKEEFVSRSEAEL